MDILDQFLTLPMVLFCLFVWFLASVPKLVVEMIFPKLKSSALYKKIEFLCDEFVPPVIGMVLAGFIMSYPFPNSLKDSSSGRVIFGAICGLVAGPAHRILFDILRKIIMAKFGVNIPENISELGMEKATPALSDKNLPKPDESPTV